MSSPENSESGLARRATPPDGPITLCPADAAALDDLLGTPGLAPADRPPIDPARRERVGAWLAVVATSQTAHPAADLVGRTLQAVATDDALTLATQRRDEEPPTRGWRFGRHFAEFAAMAVAASLLIAVLIPGLGQARHNAQRVACVANLATNGNAFALYASQNHDQLPSLPTPPDGNWLPPEERTAASTPITGHSNTANLLPLVRQQFITAQRLACPARGTAAVAFDPQQEDIHDQARGYSYANLFGRVRPQWDHQLTTAVLADRNPLFPPSRAGNPHLNSPNHGPRGTNVLAADGSVQWAATPDIGPGGDNIWTIGRDCRTSYAGTEVVVQANDVFLSP